MHCNTCKRCDFLHAKILAVSVHIIFCCILFSKFTEQEHTQAGSIYFGNFNEKKKTDALIFEYCEYRDHQWLWSTASILYFDVDAANEKVKHQTENIPKLELDMCVKLISDKMLD